MRSARAGEATVGVSCGHRVPRKPRREGAQKLYRCEASSEWRMSGTRSTGEHGHPELQALAALVRGLAAPVEIRVPQPLEPWRVELIAKLGGRGIVDPNGCASCGRFRIRCACIP